MIKRLKNIRILFFVMLIMGACTRDDTTVFDEIYVLAEQNNFFKALEKYELEKNNLSKFHRQYFKAVLYNAFNKLQKSERNILNITQNKNSLPDSLLLKLYEIKYDNAVKLCKYKKAKNTVLTILEDYKKLLDKEQINNYKNNLKIWSALENVPIQRVNISKTTKIKMQKDKAGLNTLKVLSSNKDSVNFIFDTGANLSTTSLSVAKKLKMKIFPINISVGTITGEEVISQLAVCDKLIIGNVELSNIIFLVLPNSALSFPQIDYQIFGILGFPVIEALKEIRISQSGNFIIPTKQSKFTGPSNMAMKGLTPLIYINRKHFTFDTGADQTIFYERFYNENKQEIDKNYMVDTISFGGVAGKKKFIGYTIDYTLNIGKKQVKLENISLSKDKIKRSETVYGNIGQDLIKKFDTMIINFEQMFIDFE